MTTPDYTRGVGGDPNNPPAQYGEAAATNEAASQLDQMDQNPDQQQVTDAQTDLPPGVSGQPGEPIQPPQQNSDAAKFLFSPTDRPMEPVTAGTTPAGNLAPPPDLTDWLEPLQQAAQAPDASPQLRLLYSAIAQSVGQ